MSRGPALDGQHDLAAVAVVGPVVLLVQWLEGWGVGAGSP